jgi:hypothetical protein
MRILNDSMLRHRRRGGCFLLVDYFAFPSGKTCIACLAMVESLARHRSRTAVRVTKWQDLQSFLEEQRIPSDLMDNPRLPEPNIT